MNKLWGSIGTAIFWILWPVLYVYFRLDGPRSRVMIVCGAEVLLLRVWMGDKLYTLPGGGSKRGEAMSTCAVREVFEETGINLKKSGLNKLGSRQSSQYNLRYRAEFYIVHLVRKPDLKLNNHEIFNIEWVRLDKVQESSLNDDARYALRRYKVPQQAVLV